MHLWEAHAYYQVKISLSVNLPRDSRSNSRNPNPNSYRDMADGTHELSNPGIKIKKFKCYNKWQLVCGHNVVRTIGSGRDYGKLKSMPLFSSHLLFLWTKCGPYSYGFFFK